MEQTNQTQIREDASARTLTDDAVMALAIGVRGIFVTFYTEYTLIVFLCISPSLF